MLQSIFNDIMRTKFSTTLIKEFLYRYYWFEEIPPYVIIIYKDYSLFNLFDDLILTKYLITLLKESCYLY